MFGLRLLLTELTSSVVELFDVLLKLRLRREEGAVCQDFPTDDAPVGDVVGVWDFVHFYCC